MDAIERLRYLKNRGFRRKRKMFHIPYIGDVMYVETRFIAFWITIILHVYDILVFCKSQRVIAFIMVLLITTTAQVYLPSEYILKSFIITSTTLTLLFINKSRISIYNKLENTWILSAFCGHTFYLAGYFVFDVNLYYFNLIFSVYSVLTIVMIVNNVSLVVYKKISKCRKPRFY